MHAEIASELATRRAPLRLSLNGVLYADKPPLLYALVAGAFAVGGPTEAAARTVPAVAALVAIVATAWLGARLLGGAWGVLAGMSLLTCAGFFAYARYLRPDGLFVAALAVGWALMLHGVANGTRWASGMGLAAFGIASLAKDPLGAIAPPLTLGLALALCGRLRPVSRWLPWPGVVAAAALGLGWWALAASSTPGFGWYTVVENHLLNVARARHFPDEDVGLSAIEFLAVAVAGSVPWVLAASMVLWSCVRRRAWRDPAEIAWTALGLWVIGVLGLTALSPFRLPHYALPAYPALAVLAVRAWRDVDLRRLAAAHAWLFAGMAAACFVVVVDGGELFRSSVFTATDVAARKTVAAGGPAPMPAWDAFRPLFVRTAVVLAVGAVLTRLVAPFGRAVTAAVVTVTMMVGILPGVIGGLEAVASYRGVKSLGLTVATVTAPLDLVAHEGPIENSGAFEWYSGRRPVIVDGRRSVLGFGATLGDAADTFWETGRFEEAWRGAGRVWLITARPPHQSVASRLSERRLVAETGGRRLYVNR
jgi:4-amino-4-deoxy-L-arabinose transferase-like glycosyltransferase